MRYKFRASNYRKINIEGLWLNISSIKIIISHDFLGINKFYLRNGLINPYTINIVEITLNAYVLEKSAKAPKNHVNRSWILARGNRRSRRFYARTDTHIRTYVIGAQVEAGCAFAGGTG